MVKNWTRRKTEGIFPVQTGNARPGSNHTHYVVGRAGNVRREEDGGNRMMKKTMALVMALMLMLTAVCAQATGIVIGGGSGGGGVVVGGAADSVAMQIEDDEEEETSNAPMIKAVSGGNATIFPRTQEGDTYDYADDAAVSGGKLYIRGQRLYAYAGGAQELETLFDYSKTGNGSSIRYAGNGMKLDEMDLTDEQRAQYESFPTYLVSGGDQLYGVNALTGAYGPIVDGFIQKTVNLSWDDMSIQDGDYSYARSVNSFTLVDGALYASLGPQSSSYGYNEFTLVKYDLATGERTELSAKAAMNIVPYKDGKLLIGGYGADDDWGKKVQVYDPAADAVGATLIASRDSSDPSSTGLSYNAGGFTYDAANDTIYYYQEGEVFATKDGQTMESVAYVSTNGVSDDAVAGILTGGFYAVETYDGLYVRSLDPAQRPERALRILGGYMDDTARGFADENPNVPLVFVDRWLSGAESIRNDMVSGDSNVDIYVVSLRSGFTQLMEKDYLTDLSSSKALVDDVNAMYPQIAESIMKDGKLYGFPQSFNINAWMFNETAWEKLGMGEMPTTFTQFFEGLADWEENRAEENPEYCYINLYSGKEQLFGLLLQQYIAQYDTGEAPLSLSDPKFVDAIKQVEAMDLPTYDWSTMTQEEMDAANELFNRKWLFETYSYNMLGRMYYGDDDVIRNIAPMTFAQGENPAMLADMSVYIVNPNSKNADLAMQYLEYCAANMQTEMDYMIHPDRSEPVRDPYYDSNLKSMNKYLKELEEQLEKAGEVEKVDIQAQIDSYKEWIEEYSQNEWSISAESIENYRKLAGNMVMGSHSQLLSYSDESGGLAQIQEILTRYLGGQINAEQMAKEMDKKLEMIYMENQ